MSAQPFFELWVYLAATPLAGLTLTLVAYAVAWRCYVRTGMHPVANPVLISVGLIVAVLWASDTHYQTYFDGAQFVHFLLGPAVVGLAVPLAREWESVRRLALPIAGALLVGSTVALVTTVALALALGATPATLLSLAPKSVTAPIAMGIAQKIGGVPALAAVFAVTTGVLGAALGKYVLDACRSRRLARARLRAGRGRARHRHGARVPGERRGRYLCQSRVRAARLRRRRPVSAGLRAARAREGSGGSGLVALHACLPEQEREGVGALFVLRLLGRADAVTFVEVDAQQDRLAAGGRRAPCRAAILPACQASTRGSLNPVVSSTGRIPVAVLDPGDTSSSRASP